MLVCVQLKVQLIVAHALVLRRHVKVLEVLVLPGKIVEGLVLFELLVLLSDFFLQHLLVSRPVHHQSFCFEDRQV